METEIENIPLPDSLGKTYIIRLVAVYAHFWKKTYGFQYRANFGMMGKIFDQILKQYNEYQIACLLGVFFNWKGIDGSDEMEYNKVAKAGFSIFWFQKMLSTYEVYLRNVLDVNIDDVEQMKKFLKELGVNT